MIGGEFVFHDEWSLGEVDGVTVFLELETLGLGLGFGAEVGGAPGVLCGEGLFEKLAVGGGLHASLRNLVGALGGGRHLFGGGVRERSALLDVHGSSSDNYYVWAAYKRISPFVYIHSNQSSEFLSILNFTRHPAIQP